MNPIGYLETGVLICGDNLERLAEFPDGCIDLIYLDPPFFSNKQYEVIWGDEAEVRSFEDRWKGGMNHYVEWMRERVTHLHRVLSPTGSLYLHCDWHASHYLKQMADEVFGANQFQNEIIWYYRGGGVSPRRWGRRHDAIFFYTKGKKWTFNVDPVRTEYSESVLESLPSRYDKSYRGDRVYSGYRPNPLGKHPDDVWPLQPLMPSDKRERLGYPTQKPLTLLDRIISASSNPDDIVLDPFAGCGTAVLAAQLLNRQWVGIDISPTAVNLMARRLSASGIKAKTYGLPANEADLRKLKPFEFQNWIIQRVHGTHSPRKVGDLGIDGFSFFENLPIQVKQSERVGRNVVDNFETAIRRAGAHKGYIIAFSFGRGAHEEAARARTEGLEIALVDVSNLIDVPDIAPRPGVEQLRADLFNAIRVAATDIGAERPPERSIDELVASQQSDMG